jgi:hypothetical protein
VRGFDRNSLLSGQRIAGSFSERGMEGLGRRVVAGLGLDDGTGSPLSTDGRRSIRLRRSRRDHGVRTYSIYVGVERSLIVDPNV